MFLLLALAGVLCFAAAVILAVAAYFFMQRKPAGPAKAPVSSGPVPGARPAPVEAPVAQASASGLPGVESSGSTSAVIPPSAAEPAVARRSAGATIIAFDDDDDDDGK